LTLALLKENYYLYLLPVDMTTGFNLEKLIIINNPFIEVFNSNLWDIETEVYKITKKHG